MKQQSLIRIGFFFFLFTIGFLVGAGISKTIRHISNNMHGKKVIIPVTAAYLKCANIAAISHPLNTKA